MSPLETLPASGVRVLVWLGGEVRIAIFHGDFWNYLGPGSTYYTRMAPERWCAIPALPDDLGTRT
jgi:hypothetical protein